LIKHFFSICEEATAAFTRYRSPPVDDAADNVGEVALALEDVPLEDLTGSCSIFLIFSQQKDY